MTSSYSHCSDCGSWVTDLEFVGRGSWVVDRRVGFAVRMAWYGAGLRVLGSAMEWLCSVVLGCGWLLWMAWYGVRLRVLGSAMEWLCFVVLGPAMEWLCSVVLGCGWLLRMAWYGARLQVLGSTMEIGETEMRFGDGDWRDKDERWETEEREWDKILLFFYNSCYIAILCLELHCSIIAKKFTIVTLSILQCRWF